MPTDPVEKLKAAKAALRANQRAEQAAGITHETDEYLRLNRAVIEAEKDVAWWRR